MAIWLCIMIKAFRKLINSSWKMAQDFIIGTNQSITPSIYQKTWWISEITMTKPWSSTLPNWVKTWKNCTETKTSLVREALSKDWIRNLYIIEPYQAHLQRTTSSWIGLTRINSGRYSLTTNTTTLTDQSLNKVKVTTLLIMLTIWEQ